MEKREDYSVILEAYKRYESLAKGKKMTEKQMSIKSKELFRLADRQLLFLNSPSTTKLEKQKILKKCKPLYQQYIQFKLGNPERMMKSLTVKMEQLLQQMALYEGEQLFQYLRYETGGDKIDIKAIFLDDSNVRKLMESPIEMIIKNALTDRRFTIVSKTDQKVYITQSGQKYHKANCPYCRRFQLIEASFAKIENAGYIPCRCIKETNKIVCKKEYLSEVEKRSVEKRTMTVFIDESVRNCAWRRLDESLSDKQASYSYIICKGNLTSETEICDENILSSNACLANEAKDTTFSAIEAISSVLMKIAFCYDFHGDVVIYTDNMAAKDKWYHKDSNIYLASLFESVKVCHVPREQNTRADAVGRAVSFSNVPLSFIQRIEAKCREYDNIKQELDFVKQYFPVPMKNIPNFLEELRLLSLEKKENSV